MTRSDPERNPEVEPGTHASDEAELISRRPSLAWSENESEVDVMERFAYGTKSAIFVVAGMAVLAAALGVAKESPLVKMMQSPVRAALHQE